MRRSSLFLPVTKGAALVVTLGVLVIVTVFVLAYMAVVQFDRQSASLAAASTRAELLARSTGNLVLKDLLGEIQAGSTNIGTITNVSYLPTTNTTMLPQRILAAMSMATSTNFDRLYKQSLPTNAYAGAAYSGPGPRRASDVGTWEPARNGRILSAVRWNQPRLLPGTGFAATNELPRWVYFTRQETSDPAGLNPTVWTAELADPLSTNWVIGRAAYNVYEIGGCLDINVAGRRSDNTRQELLSSLAGAALNKIPGVTDGSLVVNWRNAATAGTAGAYRTYATSNGLRDGFLKMPAGDRRFLGRQDLISFAENYGAGGLAPEALPFLTHFSRGIRRPTHQSTPVTTVLAGYPARPNEISDPPLAAVYSATTTVRLLDGADVTAPENTPVAFRRFPLRLLGLLTSDATALKDASDPIYRAFGIHRASPASPWIYDHGDPERILTLSQVAAEQREPDFFEMLQAAINSGSLGVAAQGDSVATYNSYSALGKEQDMNFYRHVLQIGANVIDQYDEDDFPTEIAMQTGAATASVYGVENLPYLSEIFSAVYRPAALPRTKVRGYLQFELWNPHQNAITAGSQELRVALTGGSMRLSASARTLDGSFAADYPAGFAPATAGVFGTGSNFTLTPLTLAFQNGPGLAEPRLLGTPDDGPPKTHPVLDTNAPESVVVETTPITPEQTTAYNVRFVGLVFDDLELPDDFVDGIADGYAYKSHTDSLGQPPNVAPTCYNFVASLPSSLTVELQINTPDGWKTYQVVRNIRELGDFSALYRKDLGLSFTRLRQFPTSEPGKPIWVGLTSNRAVDPRVSRFSWENADSPNPSASQRSTVAGVYNPVGGQALNGPGWTNPGVSGRFRYAHLAANTPDAVSPYGGTISGVGPYYQHPDGILRRADGEERSTVGGVGLSDAQRVYPLVENRYASAASAGADRPLILNRPFESVGEMGYAFRDEPWRTLDLWTAESGDSGLLDFFTMETTGLDERLRPLVAGVLNPNTAAVPVLEAILSGAIRSERDSTPLSDSEVSAIASALRSDAVASPLTSTAELAKLVDGSALPGSGIFRKTEKESVIRVLSDVAEADAWNVLIDVIAQAGRFPPSATGLRDFVVQAEARVWIAAALDRKTGEIIEISTELVTK